MLYFFILLPVFVSGDVFVLTKDGNVTCVLTNESVYSALVDIKRPLKELTHWVGNDWTMTSTKAQSYYPITDIRWETLKEAKMKEITLNQKSATSWSVCLQRPNLHMTGYDDNNHNQFITLESQYHDVQDSNSCQWSHYVVTNNQILTFNGTFLWKTSGHVTKLAFRSLDVKIHDYDFRYSNSTTLNDGMSYLDVSNVSESSRLCVSMFVSVDEGCLLDVVLESGGLSQSKRIPGFNKETHLKSWKRVEISTDSYNGSARIRFYRTRSDDKRIGYWAIDKVHLCGPNPEICNTQICRSLNKNEGQIVWNKTGYLNGVSCGEILGPSYPFCEKHKVCVEGGTCLCLWGYQGDSCDRACDFPFYGLNCTSKYDISRCDHYDNVQGCTGCKKRFFGTQCSDTLPVVLERPLLAAIDKNSITIDLESLKYGTEEAEPDYYQIQYKQMNAPEFKNFSGLVPVTNKSVILGNLSPQNFAYAIRVLLVVQNRFFDDGIPELTIDVRSNHSDIVQIQASTVEMVGNNRVYIFVAIFGVATIVTALAYFHFKKKFKTNLRDEELPLVPLDSRDINVENLEHYLTSVLLDSDQLIQEFQSLQNQKTNSCHCGLKDENLSKNRDKDYIPYDSTRVVLDDLPSVGVGDYINASYIKGYNLTSYIACQGPKFSTIRDFWRMVWQEEVDTIVMTDNCTEPDGTRNSAEYWTSGVDQICEFGALTVTVLSEKIHHSYQVRILKVDYLGTIRKIRHFSLTADPLFPDDVLPVLKDLTSTRPIVVHCGLGVHRTGMFILSHFAIQMGEMNRKINFYDIVKTMREQRPHMVSRVEDYILAHLTVLEYYMQNENPFKTSVNEILGSNPIIEQMQYLERLYWHDSICDNARKSDQFLYRSQPMGDEVCDFWNTVRSKRVEYILSLNTLQHQLWPYQFSDGTNSIQIIQLSSTDNSPEYSVTQLLLVISEPSAKKVLEEQEVRFFEFRDWNAGRLAPESSTDLLTLVQYIRKVMKDDQKPILITCQNGVSCCGLFTILLNVLENYSKESEIDICRFVRAFKRQKPDFTIHPVQLGFIYRAIVEYLNKFDQYNHIYSLEVSPRYHL